MVAPKKRHIHTGRIDVDTGVTLEQYTVRTFFHVDPITTLCYREDKRNEIARDNLADYRIATVKLEIAVTGIDCALRFPRLHPFGDPDRKLHRLLHLDIDLTLVRDVAVHVGPPGTTVQAQVDP
tara:strand:+ start:81 stop:452 length:372 start_codon:yes stop_codon:yes gene_type:complete